MIKKYLNKIFLTVLLKKVKAEIPTKKLNKILFTKIAITNSTDGVGGRYGIGFALINTGTNKKGNINKNFFNFLNLSHIIYS